MLDATTSDDLPNDVEALRALLIESRAQTARLHVTVRHHQAQIDKLKQQLAKLKRLQFGRSSEKLDQQIEQLELLIEELETPSVAAAAAPAAAASSTPVRRPLPDHLPRESVVHAPAAACPSCGARCAASAKISPKSSTSSRSTGR
jgi:transposase